MKARNEFPEGKIGHDEYFGQFVTDFLVDQIGRLIGRERIKNSTDIHFNDIPLQEWDRLSSLVKQCVGRKIVETTEFSGVSLSECVCVAKAAAKRIKEEECI